MQMLRTAFGEVAGQDPQHLVEVGAQGAVGRLLHTEVEAANRIAAERGWTIRFVYDGEDIVRYDRKPIV